MRVPDQANSTSETGSATARRPRIRQRLRTPLEARQWRRRVAAWVIGALAFVLIVNALVGEDGYIAIMRAQNEQQELSDAVRKLRNENQRSRQRIDRLKKDPQELEDAARRYLHMSKPGEKVIVVSPKPTPAAPAPSASPSK